MNKLQERHGASAKDVHSLLKEDLARAQLARKKITAPIGLDLEAVAELERPAKRSIRNAVSNSDVQVEFSKKLDTDTLLVLV